MKRAVTSAMKLGAEGIRVNCAGRLGGAEIADYAQMIVDDELCCMVNRYLGGIVVDQQTLAWPAASVGTSTAWAPSGENPASGPSRIS